MRFLFFIVIINVGSTTLSVGELSCEGLKQSFLKALEKYKKVEQPIKVESKLILSKDMDVGSAKAGTDRGRLLRVISHHAAYVGQKTDPTKLVKSILRNLEVAKPTTILPDLLTGSPVINLPTQIGGGGVLLIFPFLSPARLLLWKRLQRNRVFSRILLLMNGFLWRVEYPRSVENHLRRLRVNYSFLLLQS